LVDQPEIDWYYRPGCNPCWAALLQIGLIDCQTWHAKAPQRILSGFLVEDVHVLGICSKRNAALHHWGPKSFALFSYMKNLIAEDKWSWQYLICEPPKMFFNLKSWRDRFDQARTQKDTSLVRELLDELATEYRKMCHEEASSLSARLVME
jgi:hypothetical protein